MTAREPTNDDIWLDQTETLNSERQLNKLAGPTDGFAVGVKAIAAILFVGGLTAGLLIGTGDRYGAAFADQSGLGAAIAAGSAISGIFLYVAGHVLAVLADAAKSLRIINNRLGELERPGSREA